MKRITLLIPAYNEEHVLEKLYSRLATLAEKERAYEFEFLFVNDGSRDQTLPIIQNLAAQDSRISYINLSRNFGKEIAMIAGIDHVDSDALVIIDADLQDPPELIPKMIKHWEQGYDDVYARRSSRKGESWFKKLTSTLFYRVLQRTTHIEIQRDTGDFRLLDRRCVDAIKQLRENQRYTKGFFSWIGFKKKEITYVRDPRAGGMTKWNYFKLINLAIDGIVSFTTAPLRISTFFGMLISLFAFLYIIVIVVRVMLYGVDVSGYASLMAAILFLGGVQLLSLGIIGEYIGRIFNETKNRPLYLIEHYHNGARKK